MKATHTSPSEARLYVTKVFVQGFWGRETLIIETLRGRGEKTKFYTKDHEAAGVGSSYLQLKTKKKKTLPTQNIS